MSTFRANLMLRSTQVVAAFDAAPALSTDNAPHSNRTRPQHPQNHRVEDRVDGEAGPDGTKQDF